MVWLPDMDCLINVNYSILAFSDPVLAANQIWQPRRVSTQQTRLMSPRGEATIFPGTRQSAWAHAFVSHIFLVKMDF